MRELLLKMAGGEQSPPRAKAGEIFSAWVWSCLAIACIALLERYSTVISVFPLLIGKILDASNPAIVQAVENGTMSQAEAATQYNYTNPLIMLACLGIAAFILGFILKVVDKKQGLGLELPNLKK